MLNTFDFINLLDQDLNLYALHIAFEVDQILSTSKEWDRNDQRGFVRCLILI